MTAEPQNRKIWVWVEAAVSVGKRFTKEGAVSTAYRDSRYTKGHN